jgi:hypothetical protein
MNAAYMPLRLSTLARRGGQVEAAGPIDSLKSKISPAKRMAGKNQKS